MKCAIPMKYTITTRTILTVSVLALAGCTVGPNYRRPQLALPGDFRGAPPSVPAAAPPTPPNAAAPDPAASLADTKWQDLFADPTLNQMVSTALANNFDLRIAAERVEQARQQLGITRANQYPFVDAQAGFTAARSSSIGASGALVPAGTKLSDSYTSLGAALSWELDVWGRLRRLTEAARARYLASQEGRRDVAVSLVSDVMDGYFQLLEQDLELEISRKTQGIAKDSLNLVELRRQRGAASGLDVRQAEQLLYTASAQSAATERAIAQSEDLLSLLQGAAPAVQARGRKLEEIPIPAQMPAGPPSVLLERRPDIREAEQSLVAANAEIGAARALYFPQLSLSAFAGGQSRSLLELVSAPARVYSVAPSALQSIFHAGQIRSQVRFSEAQQRELLIAYQRSIYTALREVSDALIGFDRLREQRSQEEQLVRTLEDTVRLSELRYKGGLDSYLQVLDAQRNLFNGQLTLAQLRLQERVSVVQLYRALGGGWS
ncbi:MAG TPA: efflux transporter outer membrane subunit [Candidatus Acidoferrales bacterium]|jgi:NodT family efflux transporter outer membrane factor (OMF) lipoprotein|nr:efflux transporter outer membrane subunit [Candidatus Acidoferrales bacterium]